MANSADDKLVIFVLFYPENRIWHFMQIVSNRDVFHEMSNPFLCVCVCVCACACVCLCECVCVCVCVCVWRDPELLFTKYINFLINQ